MQKEFTEYLKYFTLSAVILIFSLAFNHLFTDIKRLYIDTHFGAVISDIIYIIFIIIVLVILLQFFKPKGYKLF